jgi:Ca-activated chloride channel family protein
MTRLDAVKQAFRDFVVGKDDMAGRPNDLIGLVVFGGFADAICPHTLDHGTLLSILETVEVAQPVLDRMGNVSSDLDELFQQERLTAIGDAVALAVDRLRGLEAKSKIIILLSDGENTAGVVTPAEAAKVARQFAIKIYTIGIGRTGSAPFEVVGRDGRTRVQAAEVVMDEKMLRMLADTSDGKYFHAENRDALVRVYEEIDKLEKSEIEGFVFSRYRERCQLALIPAVLLLLAQAVLDTTLFRSLP